ncbi:bifunctional metallophosphatase/5'-nucleotidase [Amphibacillus sp. Q70]|uniref:bifunctional metallophosphatase/5'-nucleotidase n=1 Tax=Amphibacillus sp. Q70 TaxID=3453416 RepID=UPI003F86D910
MLSRKIKIILLLTAALVLGACEAGTEAEAEEETVNITILGTADVHGFLMPWDYEVDEEITNGSLSQISTAIKEYRENNDHVILVDAGDLIQGNNIDMFADEEEHPGVKAFNYLEYDAWTLGNHEFDFGAETMENIISQFNNTILAGNLVMEDGSEIAQGYEIIEKDGVNVALIGMTTPTTMLFNKDNDLSQYLDIIDPVEETKKVVAELEDQADVFVGVMHMGLENENGIPNTGVTDLANAVPELDAIIASHMHENISQEVVNDVVITEPDAYANYLSVLNIEINKSNNEVSVETKTVDISDFERDLEFEELIAEEHQIARDDANQVLGTIEGVPMTHDDELPEVPYDFLHSTPINRFYNEVQLHYSEADVVATLTEMNHHLEGDTIHKKDINYNYNFVLGETSVFEMTGEELKTYMEWSADYFNTLNDGDITVSFNPERRGSKYSTYDTFGGLNYTIDLTEEYGNRIKNVVFEETNEPVKDDDLIKVGMNQYRLDQLLSDGEIFEDKSFEPIWVSTNEFGEEGTIRAMAMDYITNVNNGVIVTEDNPYWEIEGIDENSDEYQAVKYLANNGAIELNSSEDGELTNIESENGLEEIEASEAEEIEEKLEITGVYTNGMTRGEFYVAAHKEATE